MDLTGVPLGFKYPGTCSIGCGLRTKLSRVPYTGRAGLLECGYFVTMLARTLHSRCGSVPVVHLRRVAVGRLPCYSSHERVKLRKYASAKPRHVSLCFRAKFIFLIFTRNHFSSPFPHLDPRPSPLLYVQYFSPSSSTNTAEQKTVSSTIRWFLH
jgi:hypothetical protein